MRKHLQANTKSKRNCQTRSMIQSSSSYTFIKSGVYYGDKAELRHVLSANSSQPTPLSQLLSADNRPSPPLLVSVMCVCWSPSLLLGTSLSLSHGWLSHVFFFLLSSPSFSDKIQLQIICEHWLFKH
ncbi:uncharacterized protein YALI1_D16354g [Yarrowia lipolytica]|uniref:Uncharacterized protein n=1 Tax=Yarrowia lipolytica TaxID=4952 RepID=A0A1D8NEE6_YARLL|nr:hypothetical protein YALI1_D16354g [Yarrowia lipolytica]